MHDVTHQCFIFMHSGPFGNPSCFVLHAQWTAYAQWTALQTRKQKKQPPSHSRIYYTSSTMLSLTKPLPAPINIALIASQATPTDHNAARHPLAITLGHATKNQRAMSQPQKEKDTERP